jgi:predicted neuraminidase
MDPSEFMSARRRILTETIRQHDDDLELVNTTHSNYVLPVDPSHDSSLLG